MEIIPLQDASGYFIRVTTEEGMAIIKSLSSQMLAQSPNVGRTEFIGSGGEYLTIAVIPPERVCHCGAMTGDVTDADVDARAAALVGHERFAVRSDKGIPTAIVVGERDLLHLAPSARNSACAATVAHLLNLSCGVSESPRRRHRAASKPQAPGVASDSEPTRPETATTEQEVDHE